MDLVFILLPLALLIAGLMLALFIWAVRSGQFDDLDTPPVRMLLDEHKRPPSDTHANHKPEQQDIQPDD